MEKEGNSWLPQKPSLFPASEGFHMLRTKAWSDFFFALHLAVLEDNHMQSAPFHTRQEKGYYINDTKGSQ